MTPEQLDEIEKLAEAATPGPWETVVEEFHADSGAHQVALHDCFSEQDAEKNAAFIAAMREYALPLVKAVREARAERDVARARLSNLLARIHRDGGHYEAKNGTAKAVVDADVSVAQTFAERDEARAEVERLRGERDEARKWLEGICVEFESTIAHAEWRAAGSKGMSVPFFGDFANATRHPGMIGRMGWWVKQFRAALKEEG